MSLVTAQQVADWGKLNPKNETDWTELEGIVDSVDALINAFYTVDATPASLLISAAKLQAARWYRRRDTPEGVNGLGTEFSLRVNAFDPDIEQMLSPYRVWRIG